MKRIHLFCGRPSARGWAGWTRRLLAWLVLIGCCGCKPGATGVTPVPPDAPADTSSDTSTLSTPPEAKPATTQQSHKKSTPPEGGTWYISSMGGARVGYERTATIPFTRDGRELVRVELLSHMVVKRAGEEIAMDIEFVSIETPDGRLLEFEGQVSQGPVPMRMAGRVVGNELEIKTTTMGKTETSSLPWSDDIGGFEADQQSLSRNPMKPGERRTIRALLPGLNQVATLELVARQYEPVQLLTGTHDLLRIDTTTTFPDGTAMQGSVWTDRTGEVLKHRMEAMNIQIFRATRAEALEETGPVEFDLVRDVKVHVDRPLRWPQETKWVRYRVTLDGADPAAVFVSGPSQQVKSIDPHTAEVTVYALRPDSPLANPDATDDPPTDDDIEPNNLIQSDYPAIVAKARQTAGDEQDPWLVAVALERRTAELITRSGYSQAFATAAEVVDSGEGDCTEHAVLLAALCRARGIPARVAIGLVYVDQAFWYHMWTEVHVAHRWIPLDATRPHGGVGADRLKMAHSNLKGASALSSFLPVLEVIGRLKIEILEVKSGE